MTLEELSQEFDVSRERIRQIEVRAFEKVQKAVKRSAQKAGRARRALTRFCHRVFPHSGNRFAHFAVSGL